MKKTKEVKIVGCKTCEFLTDYDYDHKCILTNREIFIDENTSDTKIDEHCPFLKTNIVFSLKGLLNVINIQND